MIELFAEPEGEIYRPYLLREATVHFVHSNSGVEGSRKILRINPILDSGIDWESTASVDAVSLVNEPASGTGFANLPGYAMNAKNYKAPEKDFADDLYREEREEIWSCPLVDAWGEIGESESEFRVRIGHQAKEKRDQAAEKIRDAAAGKVRTLESRIRTAEARLSKEEAESTSAKMQAGISVFGGIMKAIFGRKAGLGRAASGISVSKATTAYKQHKDVANAEARISDLQEELEAIHDAMDQKLAEIASTYDPLSLTLEKEILKPRRTDVNVERVALLWK